MSTSSATSLADVGLLILRVGVGATIIQAGLRKASDFDTAVGSMESGGWQLPMFAAFMVTVAETAGGIGLLLDLLTPLVACAVVVAMIDASAVNVSAAAFWSDPFNVPFLIAVGTGALLFTGAAATPPTPGSSEAGALASVSRWTARRGDRRGAADLDIAERDEPDPLHRPGRPVLGPSELRRARRADAIAPCHRRVAELLRSPTCGVGPARCEADYCRVTGKPTRR